MGNSPVTVLGLSVLFHKSGFVGFGENIEIFTWRYLF